MSHEPLARAARLFPSMPVVCCVLVLWTMGGAGTLAAQTPPQAPAATAAQPAADAPAADSGSKWEVEVHGAWAINSTQTAGAGALPFTGSTVGGQVSATSFYFGEGARLFNQAVGAGAPAIVPLDTTLQASAIERQHHTPTVGIRLTRSITPHFGVELSVDGSRPTLAFSDAALSRIEATRASFVPAIAHALGTPTAQQSVTSTTTITAPATMSQVFATGAVVINLREEGRALPYVTVGGGAAFNSGDAPGATLTGNYRFGNTTTVLGTDSVALRYTLQSPTAVVVTGGGVKYAVSPRWGLRFDGRVYWYENAVINLVDATPASAIQTTGDPLPLVNAGALRFSATAPLTGNQITGATTFLGSGWQTQIALSAGLFWRF